MCRIASGREVHFQRVDVNCPRCGVAMLMRYDDRRWKGFWECPECWSSWRVVKVQVGRKVSWYPERGRILRDEDHD